MEAEWDPAKARSNLAKHEINFADVETVFDDQFAISIPDMGSAGESRFVAVGADALGRILVVSYTLPAKQDSHHLGAPCDPIGTQRLWKRNTTLAGASEGQ